MTTETDNEWWQHYLERELARVQELHTGLMKESDRRVEVAEAELAEWTRRDVAAAAPSDTPSDSVVVPREIYQGALNYIQHVGANNVMRGELHPQQWLVDGMLAAAPTNAAPRPHYDATCPCGKYVFGIPSAVAAPTDTPSDSVMVPRELIEGAIRVAELWSTESSVAIGLRKLLAAAPGAEAARKP